MFRKKKIYNYLLFFSAISISILFAEVFLHIVKYEYQPLNIEVANNSNCSGCNDWREYHAFKDSSFVYDPNLMWRPKVSSETIFNKQGFRGETINNKNLYYYKILTIGDSNTLGPATAEDKSWPHYLEELLQKNNKEVVVMNAGVWGYSSFQGLRRFKELLPYKPNIVLISFGSNDASFVFTPDKKWSKQSVALFKFINKFKLANLLEAVSFKASVAINKTISTEPTYRVSLEDYEKNLEEMISISRQNNIIPILLTRPFIGSSNSPFWWKNFAPAYNKVVIKVGQENNVDYIDIYSLFENKEDLFIDESHFSDYGNKVMAEIIYKNLLALFLKNKIHE